LTEVILGLKELGVKGVEERKEKHLLLGY